MRFYDVSESLCGRKYRNLFLELPFKLEETELLFGKGVIGKRSEVLNGLSKGGVYRRHQDYNESTTPIRFSVLNLSNLNSMSLIFSDVRYLELFYPLNILPCNFRWNFLLFLQAFLRQ